MKVTVQTIEEASKRLENVVSQTPLTFSRRLSAQYGANVYLKREDLQEVRSFKIRGAYNKMATLTAAEKKRGVVAASAGNHAQGVALSCFLLKVHGTIFMPAGTPMQKVNRVKRFGDGFITIKLIGRTYDDASKAAHDFCHKKGAVYVHPFDDGLTISGQGTVAMEILEQSNGDVDYVVGAIGGGGLMAGVSTYFKAKKPYVKLFGAEPTGAAAMYEAFKKGKPVTLPTIDTFVDGAAVQRVGDDTYAICKENLEEVLLAPEGKICTTMIELYQNEGIVTEPAGALAVSVLDDIAEEIKGKTVVCIISGGNNDILRYPEIMERSLIYQGKKHYFIIEFAQKPGQLKSFLVKALGPTDDVARIEYTKKTDKEKGPTLVGIEFQDKKDFEPLISRMDELGLKYKHLNGDEMLYKYLV